MACLKLPLSTRFAASNGIRIYPLHRFETGFSHMRVGSVKITFPRGGKKQKIVTERHLDIEKLSKRLDKAVLKVMMDRSEPVFQAEEDVQVYHRPDRIYYDWLRYMNQKDGTSIRHQIVSIDNLLDVAPIYIGFITFIDGDNSITKGPVRHESGMAAVNECSRLIFMEVGGTESTLFDPDFRKWLDLEVQRGNLVDLD